MVDAIWIMMAHIHILIQKMNKLQDYNVLGVDKLVINFTVEMMI